MGNKFYKENITKMFGGQPAPISKDMLCIQIVREKMANQWDEEITRNRNAKRLEIMANRTYNNITLLKRDSRHQSTMISCLSDDAKNVNKKLAEMLTRDPRVLPQEVIDAARKSRK